MANDDPSEAGVIERVQGGDTGAYDVLVSRYLRRVVSIAHGIVRNAHDAEDLAQEAFVRAYENIGRFRSGEPFGPWIYRIVTNLALDVAKHRAKFRHEEISEGASAGRRDDAELPAVAGEIGRRIDLAIEELPGMQKLVARLSLVEELDHQEIAAVTGLTEGTVRSHLSHARTKLREKLADLYGDGHE